MIKLSVQQVLDMTEVSIEAFRHWRRVLPPLQGRNGYVANFSPTDVLFLIAVKSLVKDLGIPVSALVDASRPLHAYLSQIGSPTVEEKVVISLPAGEVVSGHQMDSLEPPFVVLPLNRFIAQLHAAWSDAAQQLRLRFDNEAVSSARGMH